MPDIPNLPGVPALTSYIPNPISFLTNDVLGVLEASLFSNRWGVFIHFTPIPVLFYDSEISFDYKQDWPISTYPVEQGGFQSYDKVRLPAEIRIRLSAGGSTLNRQAFLLSIDASIGTTGLYDIVTPEQVYFSYCFTHRDFDRTADKVGLIVVDLWFTEVLTTSTAEFQTVADPAVAGQSNPGTVPPGPSQAPGSTVSGVQFPGITGMAPFSSAFQ